MVEANFPRRTTSQKYYPDLNSITSSGGMAKYRLFSRATTLIRDPYKDSALAAKFQKPSYAAKDSNLVSSFPFTKEGFVRLKSIRISIGPLAVGSFPKCMKRAN